MVARSSSGGSTGLEDVVEVDVELKEAPGALLLVGNGGAAMVMGCDVVDDMGPSEDPAGPCTGRYDGTWAL